MRRISRFGWTVRFSVLAAAAFAILLSAIACDRGRNSAEKEEIVRKGRAEVLYESREGPAEASRLAPPCAAGWLMPNPSRSGLVDPNSRKRDGFVKWSPDSSRVLFTDGPEVYAVGADGSGLRQVVAASPEGGGDMGPMAYFDLSADGMNVVYSTCNYAREGTPGGVRPDEVNFELESVNFDGTDARRLTENVVFDNYPAWSPDGERIAYISTGSGAAAYGWNNVNLYSREADGTELRQLATGPLLHSPPRWSPDGERIAYAKFSERFRDPGIYVVEAGGEDERRLTDAVSGPTWSPDGSRIAYAKVDGDEIALYTIAVDGTDARRLAAIDGWQPDPKYGAPNLSKVWIQKVSWSPDGTKILLLVDEHATPEIHTIGADGSGVTKLRVRNPSPDSIRDMAWSPDGTRLAISGEFRASGRNPEIDPAAERALVTMAADGTDVRVLAGRQADGRLVGLGVKEGDISADVAACGEGVVVADPESNPGLVEDCEALLEVQNALVGPGGLNWLVDREISEWEGVMVDGTPPRVREIVLGLRDMSGWISPELSRLTELRVPDMSHNGMMGEIPSELGELTNLERLDLGGNYLSGEIPAELGKLSGLTHLSLRANNLSGEIPGEDLSELGGLTYLSLGGNNLEGEIPGELGEFSGLTYLSLGGNRLEGEIPAQLGELRHLEKLILSGNYLSGEIPAALGQLTNLELLYLDFNRLTGEIPAELGQLAKLKELNLTRGLRLHELGLVDNQFTGCIPAELREVENTDAGTLGLPDCE